VREEGGKDRAKKRFGGKRHITYGLPGGREGNPEKKKRRMEENKSMEGGKEYAAGQKKNEGDVAKKAAGQNNSRPEDGEGGK